MTDYEQKQEARRARLEQAATNAAQASTEALQRSQVLISAIPFGEPIKVGHHSERRHRRTLDRSWELLGKSVKARELADDLQRRADAVGTAGVSQDDPEAVTKLRAELAQLEAKQARIKAVSAAWRKGGREALTAAGFTPGEVEEAAAAAGRNWSKTPYIPASSTNTAANIRRIKARIEVLAAKGSTPAREPISGEGWTVYEDRDDNRMCLRFDVDRVPPEIYTMLKSHGFRRTREGVWQRHPSTTVWYWLKTIGEAYSATRAQGGA